MSNLDITNVDTGSFELSGGEFRDELVTFAGADTFVAGTILARDTGTDKLVLFVKGGSTAGNGIPNSVLAHELVATGAGDESGRVMIKGTVNLGRLVIDSDGDASNIDGVVVDELGARGITAIEVEQLAELDNQ